MVYSLEDIRKNRGYTQEQMASHLGIAVSTYNQYENGARNIPAAVALAAANYLGVNVEDIFYPQSSRLAKNFSAMDILMANRGEINVQKSHESG